MRARAGNRRRRGAAAFVQLRRATPRAEILAERDALLELAAELRDTRQDVNVRGVALVERLLTDGGSPLYTKNANETLDGAIRQARAALLLA
jgi:hypothetical protein